MTGHKSKMCTYHYVIGQEESAEVSGDSENLKIRNKRKGHKRGRKSGIRKTSSDLTVDFLNIRGIMSKIHDVNRHFVNNDADILGLVETFLKSNDRPVKLSKNLSWVGKCRKTNSCKGGIGMYMKSNITALITTSHKVCLNREDTIFAIYI